MPGTILRRSIKPLLRRVIDSFLPISALPTYSQCGEDALIRRYFCAQADISSRVNVLFNRPRVSAGYYVDIGAYSPKRLSNTYWLYTQGWRGITIEPDPTAAWTFRLTRPRDIHLSVAVGQADEDLDMEIGEYSVFNRVVAGHRANRDGSTATKTVPCRTLRSILREHVPPAQPIDLLSVDCEGHERVILESNDWERYSPRVICVEDYEWCESQGRCSELGDFLAARGYRAFGWAGASVLWEITGSDASAGGTRLNAPLVQCD